MNQAVIQSAGPFAMLILGASPVWACPLCKSETGERVRAGIFGADFGSNLAVTLLPFPIFLGIIALIYLGPPWAGSMARQAASAEAGEPRRSRPSTSEVPS